MTKVEFLQLRKTLGRESPKYDSLVAIALSAIAVLGVPVSFYASDSVSFAYLGSLLFFCVVYLVYSQRWAKRTGLLCHTCKRPLLKRAADAAIATDACPHCKKPAFGRQA